jgi:hypothetical protein
MRLPHAHERRFFRGEPLRFVCTEWDDGGFLNRSVRLWIVMLTLSAGAVAEAQTQNDPEATVIPTENYRVF